MSFSKPQACKKYAAVQGERFSMPQINKSTAFLKRFQDHPKIFSERPYVLPAMQWNFNNLLPPKIRESLRRDLEGLRTVTKGYQGLPK
jgi:hypothetical protein